jgi:hypothetical protein
VEQRGRKAAALKSEAAAAQYINFMIINIVLLPQFLFKGPLAVFGGEGRGGEGIF